MANTILVVDDAAFMRMMIKDVLTKNGYEVVGEAENGQKAIEKYKEVKVIVERPNPKCYNVSDASTYVASIFYLIK